MTTTLRSKILDILQWIGFAMMLSALCFSNFFLSFGSFWLVGVWLLNLINARLTEGESVEQYFQLFKRNPTVYVPSLIYLLPLIGLLWTEDMKFASWDLRTKLPLLFMPLLVTTLRPMREKTVKSLMIVFLLSLVVSISICIGVYFGFGKKRVLNIRDISIFISHIRLSMLLVFGIALIVLMWFRRGIHVVSGAIIILYFIGFLWLIESLTGLALLTTLSIFALIRLTFKSGNRWLRFGFAFVVIMILSGSFLYVQDRYTRYFRAEQVNFTALDSTTSRGGHYEHYIENKQLENGKYIMLYICWGELEQGWNNRSNVPFDSLDLKGNEVKWTLIRYLTSIGQRKDADGLQALSDTDIENIESGIPSANYQKKSGLERRLDKVFFELDNYRNGGSPNGHSVFQRLEFWRTGWAIFSQHPWCGVGTGDLKHKFKEQYIQDQTRLDERNQLRAHNQYLTMFITYGIVGGLMFIVILLYPLFWKSVRDNRIFISFLLIYLLSFLTEDTLETQVGVTFFALFHPFILRFLGSENET